MKIPYKLNPFGKSQSGGIPTKGLDFYAPFDTNLNDVVNGLSGLFSTSAAPVIAIENDTSSTIGNCLICNKITNSQGYALYFNNSQTLCQYGTGDFTISFWLQSPKWTNYPQNCILSKKNSGANPGFVLYRDTHRSNAITNRIGTGNVDVWTSTAVQDKKWVHWLYERKDGVGYWYRNGELDSSSEHIGDVSNTNQKIYIGYNPSWATYALFNLKALRIYNRALSTNEIKSLNEEFADIKYLIIADDQTLRFTPVRDVSKSISYTCVEPVSFQIISGELPSSITFNRSNGSFYGKALTDADHTYNLVVRISGSDTVVPKEINVTINTVAVSDLSVTTPQTFNFITEAFDTEKIAITRETEQTYATIYSGELPSGITLSNNMGLDQYFNSTGEQNVASQSQVVIAVTSQYHPEPVYATMNINVALNQITADNITLKAYTADGAKSKQIQYTTQNTITPVYSLSGTLPTGITFDSQTGTFSYDGVTTTPASEEVQVTINSSTGCSIPATITATLEIIEGTQPWEAPTSGLVFYDSLNTSTSWTTPEIGDTLTINGSSPTLSSENSINCSYFSNGALTQKNISYVQTGNHDITMSIWVKCTGTSTNFAGVYSLGHWTYYKPIELCQNQAILKIISNGNPDILINNIDITEWHHIALSYNSSSRTVLTYVDSTQISSTRYNAFMNFSSLLTIAANASSSQVVPRDSYFNGYLAGVRLYNRVLTAEEIAILSQEFNPQS